jgi:hypothetical protein
MIYSIATIVRNGRFTRWISITGIQNRSEWDEKKTPLQLLIPATVYFRSLDRDWRVKIHDQ